ncbi:MAG: hypothetical protein OEV34_07690 [Gammaproteobacteria bacterium]|jgi:hypothetical protein|nr:hypothetical protein [Gammaproteobacteria bacterium]
MNKIHLCVLPLALVLAASSGYSVAGEPRSTPDRKCKGVRQAAMVTIDVDTKEVDPECVRARLGKPIVFMLTSKKDAKDVNMKVVPKDALKDSWLQGKNDNFDDLIIIRVPGVYVPENDREYSDHEYSVWVNDHEIDPRVEVEK